MHFHCVWSASQKTTMYIRTNLYWSTESFRSCRTEGCNRTSLSPKAGSSSKLEVIKSWSLDCLSTWKLQSGQDPTCKNRMETAPVLENLHSLRKYLDCGPVALNTCLTTRVWGGLTGTWKQAETLLEQQIQVLQISSILESFHSDDFPLGCWSHSSACC